jgi:hypothetical protein
MKYLLAALGCIIILSASAQTKAKDQKAFLNALNRLIANTTSQHWAYETPFRIDSAFHIIGDTLSATFQYTDSFTYRIRYAAPIDKIKRIDHDVYLILIVPPKLVNMYENRRQRLGVVRQKNHVPHWCS